jgi:hypothetical protein
MGIWEEDGIEALSFNSSLPDPDVMNDTKEELIGIVKIESRHF